MLPANALWKQAEKRKVQKLSACKAILAQIFLRIRNQSNTAPESPYIAYPVPSFVFGYPLYSVNDAVPYLKETLEEQGYQVWVTHPNTLFISWMKPDKKDQRKLAYGPSKSAASYRPFVYDESSLQILREKME